MSEDKTHTRRHARYCSALRRGVARLTRPSANDRRGRALSVPTHQHDQPSRSPTPHTGGVDQSLD